MSLPISEFSGSMVLSSQIEQLDQAAEDAEARLCQLVGDVLVKIGEHNQLLRFEQLELKKENAALKQQIAQLKIVHVAAWDAVHMDFQGKMAAVSEKLKAIVDRFQWVKESLLDVSLQQLRNNLRSITSNGSAVQGYYRASGIVQVRIDCDTCLADEGCESISAEWLKVTNDDATYAKKLSYPGYLRLDGSINPIAPRPQEGVQAEIVPFSSDLMVRKFTQSHIEKYQALATDTAIMRAANRVLQAEKDWMIEVHPWNIRALKQLFASTFNLPKARLMCSLIGKKINSTDRFCGAKDPRDESRLLADTRLQWVQEGYVQEAKLTHSLIMPLISTLEGFIADYGYQVVELKPLKFSLFPNEKMSLNELSYCFSKIDHLRDELKLKESE